MVKSQQNRIELVTRPYLQPGRPGAFRLVKKRRRVCCFRRQGRCSSNSQHSARLYDPPLLSENCDTITKDFFDNTGEEKKNDFCNSAVVWTNDSLVFFLFLS